ncbi:MAG: hypothetical protein AB9873_05000 [Syntrophobacteraceae bacterium]
MDAEADFFDAIWAQLIAELDLTGKLTNTAKAWGAMASRGLNSWFRTPYNDAWTDSGVAFYFNFPPMKSVKTKGNILQAWDYHEYIINPTQAGLDLTVTVTPNTRAGAIVNPEIRLWDSAGNLLQTSTLSRGKATLTFSNLTQNDVAVIWVTGDTTNFGTYTRGNYDLTVSVAGATGSSGGSGYVPPDPDPAPGGH